MTTRVDVHTGAKRRSRRPKGLPALNQSPAIASQSPASPSPSLFHFKSCSPTSASGETPGDTVTPKTKRSLLPRPRRSVPSFLPSLQSSRNFISAATPTDTLTPNAEPILARPDVKSMPSSVAYSETLALPSDHGRSLNGSYRLGADRVPNMDDGRPKNDDIFLNIARSDSGRRDSLGRSDFRRVSFSLHHGR